ncbi:MAG: hypothetical protein ABR577_17740 [Pyrinomonadaceae bacterium]
MSSKTRTNKKNLVVGRRIVRAWFDTIINPLLSGLKTEQDFLYKKFWTWQSQPSHLESIRPIRSMISGLYEDNLEQFLDFFPNLKTDMDEHDGKAATLLAECESLYKILFESSALREVYKSLTSAESLAKLDIAEEEKNVYSLLGSSRQELHLELLAQHTVNNTIWLPSYYTTAPFWNRYKNEFLALLEHPNIHEYNIQTVKAGESLLKAVEHLINSLKATRAELSLQHDEPLVAVETLSDDRGF